MGKKKAAARSGVSKRTPSKGLSETGLEAVADDAFEQMEEAEAAAAIAGGGARTVNPELQKRLDLLAELSRRGDIRGFVRVFVPHDLTQDDTDYFAGELEGDETRWQQLAGGPAHRRWVQGAKDRRGPNDARGVQVPDAKPGPGDPEGGGVLLRERRLEG